MQKEPMSHIKRRHFYLLEKNDQKMNFSKNVKKSQQLDVQIN